MRVGRGVLSNCAGRVYVGMTCGRVESSCPRPVSSKIFYIFIFYFRYAFNLFLLFYAFFEPERERERTRESVCSREVV